jgi:hypothetical protein
MPGPVGSLAADTVRAPSTVMRMRLAGIVTSTVFTAHYLPTARLGFNKFNGLGSRQDAAREPLLARCDGVDGARAASGSMKGVPKWLSLEQPFEGAPSMGKSITDLSSVTTVGLDWPSTSFKFMALMLPGGWWSPRRSGATSCWSFSLRCRRALLDLRRAAQRIIGRAS